MTVLAELVRVTLAAARCSWSAASSAHSLVAALHGSGLLARRVVQVGLHRRFWRDPACGLSRRSRGPPRRGSGARAQQPCAVHAHDDPRASPATIAVAVDGYRTRWIVTGGTPRGCSAPRLDPRRSLVAFRGSGSRVVSRITIERFRLSSKGGVAISSNPASTGSSFRGKPGLRCGRSRRPDHRRRSRSRNWANTGSFRIVRRDPGLLLGRAVAAHGVRLPPPWVRKGSCNGCRVGVEGTAGFAPMRAALPRSQQ